MRNIHDDIIVHGKTAEHYDTRLGKVLGRIQEKGLTLNKEKHKFLTSEIEFMEHLLSARGIGPTQAKVEEVTEARKPESVAEKCTTSWACKRLCQVHPRSGYSV